MWEWRMKSINQKKIILALTITIYSWIRTPRNQYKRSGKPGKFNN